jgi:WD40 repeat protein/DNA-binding SARP family transcriptional activator
LGGPKQRLVLAHLLIRANHTVPVDRLIAEVWGEDPPPAVRSSLHGYVSHLRKALGAARIDSRGQGYALRVEPHEVDRMQFEALAAEGQRLRATDPGKAAAVMCDALDLWQGPPFVDLADAPSLQPEIARLEELRSATIEGRVGADLDCGRDRELIGELEALTAAYPLRERLWGQLMIALYRSGRQGDALAAFERARTVLADELGIDPSPELRSLHERVLGQDPSLLAGMPTLKGYRLLERVGEGPFGVVWRATQPGVDREVAVKAARPVLANRPAFIRRFEAEAQQVARIEHPHVVPLYDFWREPDGAYLVLRFLRGGSVRGLLEMSGPPDRGTALRIADHVAQALAAAHQQGVAHGNIKPSNILLDEEHNAFLSDFAIAREDGPTAPADLPYLSPERIDGASPDHRTDVYSFGVLVSELLTDADASIAAVVRRATARDPAVRQRDAAELLVALRAAAGTAAGAGALSEGGTTVDVAAPAPRNPYKGLRAFTEGDAADYFGREAVVARLLTCLREDGPAARFLAVVGPSGSGKSSLVRAGLVPTLRAGALPGSRTWYVAHMMPGDRPFDELASALRQIAVAPPDTFADQLAGDNGLERVVERILPDDGELLLVVDQFEELFTLVTEDAHRQSFVDVLVAAVTASRSRVRVIVTLRADFYDRPLEYSGLAELMRARTEAIVPMTPNELERAVTGPAERVGVAVERALVAQMSADVADQPGALPLLQYALTELFDSRQDATLSVATYQQIGGIAGALARRAEAVFAGLSDGAQEAARQLFLRLVTPGEGVEDTRRRATSGEMTGLAPEQMPAVLAVFGTARLLSFDRDPTTREPTVEVAHEALLREWRRLGGWIDATRDDLRIQRRLQAAATDWVAAGRDTSFLATGSRLDQYETWRAESGLVATELERAYVDASLAYRERAGAEEAARRERELALEGRSVRRLRTLVAVLTVAALVAGGLTVYAVSQARRAADQTLRAASEARVATARELAAAADASLQVDPERSMLLALEAIEYTRSADGSVLPEAEEALHRAVGASRMQLDVPEVGGALDWSSDGRIFVTEGPEDSGIIDIRDATTGASLRSWHGHDIDVNDVALSADGSMLATAGEDGAARVWDPATGEELAGLTESEDVQLVGPSFSADGSLLAVASPDGGWVKVLDIQSERIVTEIALPNAWATAFSPDGDRLAIAPESPPEAMMVEVDSGEEIHRLQGGHDPTFGLNRVRWSPDGRRLATAGDDGTVRIWDARTGDPTMGLFSHTGAVVDADWSADSTRLVTGGEDGTAKLWRIADGGAEELLSLSGLDTASGVGGVAFSPDGRHIMTGGADTSAVRIWDVSVSGGAEWANVPTDPASVGPVAFTPDGRHVVSSGPNGVVTVWDATDGSQTLRIDAHSGPDTYVETLDVSPDGALVAGGVSIFPADATTETAEVLYTSTAWDTATGRERFTLRHDSFVTDVAWIPGNEHLAVSDASGLVTIVDRSGDQVTVLREPRHGVNAIALSPDGRLLAAVRYGEPYIGIWDWRQGEIVHIVETYAESVAFDPNGTRLVSTHPGGRAEVWDVDSGELVRTFHGQRGRVMEADFAPDGALVATAGNDGTVRLWDPESGIERLTLTGRQTIFDTVAFSPDGTKLAAGGEDGVVQVWALVLDDLIAIAEDKLTRDFTDAECRQYLHVDRCPTS